MSVITFTQIRDSAVEQIKAAFGSNPKIHIAAHPGTFNEAEIRRLSNQTPAILTSFMRYRDSDHKIEFITWVLCRADNKDRLYNAALDIVSALIGVIRNLDTDWTIDEPSGIEAECLYTGSLDQIGVTLWGIKWEWEIPEPSAEGGIPVFDLDVFEGYDATHEVGSNSVSDNVTINNLEVTNGNTI